MTKNTSTSGFISQQDFNGYVSFNFPQPQDWGLAGPVSVVVGGEYRKEISKSSSEADSRQIPIPNDPGITISPYFFAGSPSVRGQFDVSEAFAEASVPVLAGKRWANELTLDFASRVSDYSTAGTDKTWKMDAVYSPFAGLKFRGSDAYAVRAPNIGELFAPLVQGFQPVNDPCDVEFINQGTPFRKSNCQALENALLGPGVYTAGVSKTQQPTTILALTDGNPALSPEAARTLTFGTVMQPDFLSDFVFTADWYRVRIADAIAALSAQSIADQCVDLSTLVNPYCPAVTRNGGTAQIPGSLKKVVAQEINIAQLATDGIDFTATYHADLDDWFGDHSGTLDLHLLGNRLLKYTTTALKGQAPVNSINVIAGGADGGPNPYWQFNLDAVYSLDQWSIDYNVDWYDSVLNVSRQTFVSAPNYYAKKYIHAPAHDVHSVQVSYDLQPGWNVYVGVDNLYYQKPEPNFYNYGVPADPLGRFFYVGAKFDFDPGF